MVAPFCSPLGAWKQGHPIPSEGVLDLEIRKGEKGETSVPTQCQEQSFVLPNWDPLFLEGPEASRTEETGLSKEGRNPSLSAPAPPQGPLGKTDTRACHILLGPDMLGRNLRKLGLVREETYL